MSDEDVISLSDPDSEGKFQSDPAYDELSHLAKVLLTENAFLGMAGGVLMMLLSRRRPRYPASTGKERRRETEKAQGGEERAASGREGRKAKKVSHLKVTLPFYQKFWYRT